MDRCHVCVIGSANLDLVARTQRHPAPGETVLGYDYAEHAGGKGLNQAVAATRSGARTAFIGALGNDAAGTRLRGVLSADGIDAAAVTRSPEPTGRALIVVDEHGENSIVVVPGANAHVALPHDEIDAVVTLAQLEVPLDIVADAFRRARRSGSITVLNPAPAAPLDDDLIGLCDVIAPNQHELAILGGADRLLAHGCRAVVTTLGADGAAITTTGGTTSVAPFSVDTIDTTGAGDAFCGALAARLAAGDDLDRAARWASAAGALATTVAGAVPAQPSATAIESLLAG